MKSRETLIRLKKFQVDEKRRRVSQIEGMIADFQRMSVDLEREIQTEQERAGINDPSHFAYPTYAKAAIQRRENLTRSAGAFEKPGFLAHLPQLLPEAGATLRTSIKPEPFRERRTRLQSPLAGDVEGIKHDVRH